MLRFLNFSPIRLFLLTLSLCASADAIEIQLDYTYDTGGFFDQPGAKDALRAVADFYEDRIQDSLLAIDPDDLPGNNTWTAIFFAPGTGESIEIVDLIVPTDTLVVFVGGRDLGSLGRGGPGGFGVSGTQAWVDRVIERGQAGVGDSPRTDYAPWGGALTFDSVLDNGRSWNFSTSGPVDPSSKVDFITTALHEFGHLLGVGTAESWSAFIDGDDQFNGPNAIASFGGPVPVQPDTGSGHNHWQDDGVCQFPDGFDPTNPLNVLSVAYGSFGASHATNQIARMDPVSCRIPTRTEMLVMTDLDLAALRDIGWEVRMPQVLEVVDLGPGDVAFASPSSTGETYVFQRSTDLDAGWSDLTAVVDGDGSILDFSDPSPPTTQAFYRLSNTSASAPSGAGSAADSSASGAGASEPVDLTIHFASKAPIEVDGCNACPH